MNCVDCGVRMVAAEIEECKNRCAHCAIDRRRERAKEAENREWIVKDLTRMPWRAEPHPTREDGGITICNDDENFALVPGYRNHPGNMITAHLIVTAVNAYADQQAELLRMHNEKIDNYERAIIAEAKGNAMKAALAAARAEIIALGTPNAYASPIIQQIDAALAGIDQTSPHSLTPDHQR